MSSVASNPNAEPSSSSSQSVAASIPAMSGPNSAAVPLVSEHSLSSGSRLLDNTATLTSTTSKTPSVSGDPLATHGIAGETGANIQDRLISATSSASIPEPPGKDSDTLQVPADVRATADSSLASSIPPVAVTAASTMSTSSAIATDGVMPNSNLTSTGSELEASITQPRPSSQNDEAAVAETTADSISALTAALAVIAIPTLVVEAPSKPSRIYKPSKVLTLK